MPDTELMFLLIVISSFFLLQCSKRNVFRLCLSAEVLFAV